MVQECASSLEELIRDCRSLGMRKGSRARRRPRVATTDARETGGGEALMGGLRAGAGEEKSGGGGKSIQAGWGAA